MVFVYIPILVSWPDDPSLWSELVSIYIKLSAKCVSVGIENTDGCYDATPPGILHVEKVDMLIS